MPTIGALVGKPVALLKKWVRGRFTDCLFGPGCEEQGEIGCICRRHEISPDCSWPDAYDNLAPEDFPSPSNAAIKPN